VLPLPESSPATNGHHSSTSAPTHLTAAPPPRKRRSGASIAALAAGGVLLIAGVVFAATKVVPRFFKSERADLILHVVKREPLEVTVVERGQLEAAENKDIICQIKGKGTSFATTIKWVIDDGSHVKKGEKVIELDRSGLEDQDRAQQIEVDKARADVVTAEGQLEITKSQNDSDYSAAEVALKLAKIDLRKFKLGEYPQQLADVEGRLEAAKDREAWSQRMKLKGYMSASQAEAERLSLEKIKEEFRVLTDFTKERTETDLDSKVREAERALKRVETQNAAKLNTALSDLKTKKGLLAQQEEKLKDIRDQLAVCALTAPQDGMVVYYIPEQSRSMSGSQQSIIAQGEPVREGQKLIRIPNLDHMLVNSKVHEAMVSKVKPNMKVDVRVDAFPDLVLKGSVRNVATVAIANDWRTADVKMYQVMVSIDESIPNLKPGMSARTTIFVEATENQVLAVPIQAIIGGAEMGAVRKCFVRAADGNVEEREIALGLSNDKMVEIRSGLNEGEQIVLNPKVLIGNNAKTRSPSDFENKNGNGGPEGKGKAEGKATGDVPGKAGAKGPGGPPNAGAGISDEMKKRMQEFDAQMRKASPQERKKLLEQVPEQFRAQTKDRYKAMGLEIPD
jgi:RND family efflux transporter MFP subunit